MTVLVVPEVLHESSVGGDENSMLALAKIDDVWIIRSIVAKGRILR